jgi:hypothetical protein
MAKNAGEIQALKKSLPPWILCISFEGYGVLPDDKIAYEEADFKAMAQSLKLAPVEKIGGVSTAEFSRLLNQPSPEPYWKTRLKGGVAEVFFLTTLDKTPGFTTSMNELAAEQKYPAENTGVYIQPIVQGTSCHCEFDIYYNPALEAAGAATKKFVGLAGERIAGAGGFFSRPYSAFKEAAYRNAEGTRSMQQKIKTIFDPNTILNPGKLGF